MTATRKDASSFGIVLSGGGMRCSYGAGALHALAEVHGIATPRVIVTISGSSTAAEFFRARRFADMYDWPRLFDTPRFISWRRFRNGPIMDLDFLVEVVTGQAPNLPEEVEGSPTRHFMAATRFPEAALEWLEGEPLFKHLRAVKTMPGVSDDGIRINGIQYADGCLSASLEDCIKKAQEEGAEKIIVIDHSTHGTASPFTRALMRFETRHSPSYVKEAVERFCRTDIKPVEPRPNLYICRPENLPTKNALMRSEERSLKTMKQGYEDVAKMQFA